MDLTISLTQYREERWNTEMCGRTLSGEEAGEPEPEQAESEAWQRPAGLYSADPRPKPKPVDFRKLQSYQ